MKTRGFERPSEFWAAFRTCMPDLVLLDIMLPEQDGISILKELRASPTSRDVPIIMLTAKDREFDKVVGLDAGADDYVPKPFGMMELIARVKALLRRTKGAGQVRAYRLGALYVCPDHHVVRVEGQEVSLTLKEFELLCLLMQNQDHVFTRAQLLEMVWGYACEIETRTVDMHVKTLRHKLGACASCIKTVRGVGYKIASE